jgi:hypothetical protein
LQRSDDEWDESADFPETRRRSPWIIPLRFNSKVLQIQNQIENVKLDNDNNNVVCVSRHRIQYYPVDYRIRARLLSLL